MTMDSHNTETERVVSEESVEIKTEESGVHILNWDKIEPEDLAIADDPNPGGDPYNTTGQHVIIESKINLED